jgi:hypothetical protein
MDMKYAELRLFAEMFSASQKARLANEGRMRSASVDPDVIQPMLDMDKASEALQARALKKAYRKVAVREVQEWQKAHNGIGEHLLARLLGVIGDPYIARRRFWREGDTDAGEDKKVLVEAAPFKRRVYNLYAYCGHGDPARKKFRGMTQKDAMALGSPEAKMLIHLLAESCMKQVKKDPDGVMHSTSVYRDVYDDARIHYEDRVHAADCVRCGPSGKPALAGSPWSQKHKHMAALRKVGKAIIRDLWRAARAAYVRVEAEEAARIGLPAAMIEAKRVADAEIKAALPTAKKLLKELVPSG